MLSSLLDYATISPDASHSLPFSLGAANCLRRKLATQRAGAVHAIWPCLRRPRGLMFRPQFETYHSPTDSPDEAFFEADGRTLREVIYQGRPPFFDTTNEESACFYKSRAWEYEQEWRCVRRFSHAESRLVEIEEDLITEIILGHHMEPWNVARIAWYTALRNMAPAFFLSSPEHSQWRLVNEPKTVTPCEQCFGQGFRMERRD